MLRWSLGIIFSLPRLAVWWDKGQVCSEIVLNLIEEADAKRWCVTAGSASGPKQ